MNVAVGLVFVGLGAWTYLAYQIGWGFGYQHGKQKGWRSCRQFIAEHPDARTSEKGVRI